MRRLYPNEIASEVADRLGRSLSSVYQRAKTLGLCKSEAFNKSDKSKRITRGKQSIEMQVNQFKPGQKPHNKGRKWGEFMSPEGQKASMRTQFRKGNMSGAAQRKYRPVGSLRICADGYLERKVTDDHPVPARRWVAEHRLVWEAANGPIPEGRICVFKPGMATTDPDQITAEKVECITRRENMLRNSYVTRYPKEVADVIRLRGAVNRQINKRKKASGND